MEHKHLPMPSGKLIRPSLVGLSIEDRIAWSKRWQRRKKPPEETTPPFSEEFVTFVKKLFE